MKVAIVTTGDLADMKGIMNYVQEKMRLMQKRMNDDFTVDNYFINLYPSPFVSFIHRTLKGEKLRKKVPGVINKDGVVYHCINLEHNIIDIVICKLRKEYIPLRLQRKALKVLGGYDVLATHQLPCHYLARANKKMNGVPYVATWHGSDIHSTPKQTTRGFLLTKQCLEDAGMNLFVSKALQLIADDIAPTAKKDVIYTGPSEIFKRFDEKKRQELRDAYNVKGKKVIAFVGNLVSLKNPLVMPEIMEQLLPTNPDIVCWIIGDGLLEEKLRDELKNKNIPYRLFGRVLPEKMPELMNIIDILIVPSKEEGLGLVILEASICGAACVTSRIGGMPEIVGTSNSFPLDDNFANNVADKVRTIIKTGDPGFCVREEFSWEAAINKEIGIYKKMLRDK